MSAGVVGGHRFPYHWALKDTFFTKDKGKVFSCFACGGGPLWAINLRVLMSLDVMKLTLV